jgi:hypothetical protein
MLLSCFNVGQAIFFFLAVSACRPVQFFFFLRFKHKFAQYFRKKQRILLAVKSFKKKILKTLYQIGSHHVANYKISGETLTLYLSLEIFLFHIYKL